MIILTNKAGPSSAPFMVLLLVSMSTVFGCGVIPGDESAIQVLVRDMGTTNGRLKRMGEKIISICRNCAQDHSDIPLRDLVNHRRAGFVYTETTRYPTAAKCVFWFKELIFEKEDNPWEEHRSYAKNCGFVEFSKPDDNEWTVRDFIVLVRDTILKLAEDFRKASKETEKRT